MPINSLRPRLHQDGRIRIGQKVDATDRNGKPIKRPEKLDAFRFTSASERAIRGVAQLYGGEVTPWADAPLPGQWELYSESTEIEVGLPPETMAFSQWMELWEGSGCKRRCNGEAASVPKVGPCICTQESGSTEPQDWRCAPHSRLSLFLSGLEGTGLWRLDTQGWNAANELAGDLELGKLIADALRRPVLPARLRLEWRSDKIPDPKKPGQVMTVHFAVPVLDFALDMGAIASGRLGAPGSAGALAEEEVRRQIDGAVTAPSLGAPPAELPTAEVQHISPGQSRRIHALLRSIGMPDDARHDYFGHVVKREILTERDLSVVEANQVIDDLENRQKDQQQQSRRSAKR